MTERGLQSELIEGIRARGGRATLGDLMSTTARSADEVQNAIIPALNAVGGHVAVDENGELIYSVLNPRPLPDERTLLERVVQTLVKVLSVSFITALSVVLVAYFAFYVVLLVCLAVAAVVAASQEVTAIAPARAASASSAPSAVTPAATAASSVAPRRRRRSGRCAPPNAKNPAPSGSSASSGG